jgi:hypothetical protein
MNAKEWLIVLGTAATGPAAIIGTATTFGAPVIVGAILSFLIGAAGAAKAISMTPSHPKKNPNGSVVDAEDPK